MKDYDITGAFEAIENELIASMMKNMDRHRAEEAKEGIQWAQWQAEELKSLEKYKREHQKKYKSRFSSINGQIGDMIRTSRQKGNMKQEVRILLAIRKGYKVWGKNNSSANQAMAGEFFRLNDRKLEALIEATTHDMQKAENAILRMANDQYRKAIFNAQMYANTGAGTYEKAVDMATKDMLSAGLNCVQYANGARHALKDYASMAIQTANKRAYLTGEGEKRQEWGISTVIMNKRGNPCPKCLPFVGKILIDDVWSGGAQSDGPYPLMSAAIAAGLYHPRCRDSHTTYFEGISEPPDEKFTKQDVEDIKIINKQEAERQYAKRQSDKFGRLSKYSLDDDNKRAYEAKAREWAEKLERGNRSDIIGLKEWTPEAVEQRYKDERIISNEKKESAILYDAKGKRLFHKKGAGHSVSFNQDEIIKMEDGVLTHNHPLGATFSEADINMLNKAKLSEIRAIGRDGVYVMKRPQKWSAEIDTLAKLEKVYANIDVSLKDEMEQLFTKNSMSVSDYSIMYQDRIIREMSQKYGLEYKMEVWDK